MQIRTLALMLATICGAAHAESAKYEWYGNQHACIVETARSVTMTTDTYGTWGNAPKSFFLNLTECREYAREQGLPFESTGERIEAGDPLFWEKFTTLRCWVESETLDRQSVGDRYVVETKGLRDFAEGDDWPFIESWTSNLDRLGHKLILQEDGYIDYARHEVTEKKDDHAWFILRANCSVVSP
jgi:hypothetical protein